MGESHYDEVRGGDGDQIQDVAQVQGHVNLQQFDAHNDEVYNTAAEAKSRSD